MTEVAGMYGGNSGSHAQHVHVHISVQLLASLLHFIIASVSALMVSAVQIQMMDCLNLLSLASWVGLSQLKTVLVRAQ